MLERELIGISAAFEKNFGDYNSLDWKLGVPISLKDKDGEPTINFEVKWRVVNEEHFIGLSVGKAFGKYIG